MPRGVQHFGDDLEIFRAQIHLGDAYLVGNIAAEGKQPSFLRDGWDKSHGRGQYPH